MDTALAPSQGLDFYSSGLASGRNDIFETFLGPPAREAKTSPYAKKSTARFNMPENYIGENLYLRDTVEDYMLTAKWNFWTQRILPWYKTDQIHMQWTEWENNPHYMGITPHQTPSRVVTQRRTIRKASIIRRGIAAEFELDFVTTPLGKTSFTASLGQMARSVYETGNVEVLRALLGCHHFQQVYIRKHGIVSDGDLDSWLQRKADRFMLPKRIPLAWKCWPLPLSRIRSSTMARETLGFSEERWPTIAAFARKSPSITWEARTLSTMSTTAVAAAWLKETPWAMSALSSLRA